MIKHGASLDCFKYKFFGFRKKSLEIIISSIEYKNVRQRDLLMYLSSKLVDNLIENFRRWMFKNSESLMPQEMFYYNKLCSEKIVYAIKIKNVFHLTIK